MIRYDNHPSGRHFLPGDWRHGGDATAIGARLAGVPHQRGGVGAAMEVLKAGAGV